MGRVRREKNWNQAKVLVQKCAGTFAFRLRAA